jgi:hypothetical protein
LDSLRAVILLAVLFFVCACSSESERVARYCIRWEEAVSSASNCPQMATNLRAFARSWQAYVWSDVGEICEQTTACLPCKEAAREMLVRCGQSIELADVIEEFKVSTTLRRRARE